jgi:hypothetical protein
MVQIDDDDLLDLGLGQSIYSKAQLEEFLKFQDSQGTRAYLMDTVELAYGGCGKDKS